jgi:hypothetical protein
MSDSRDQLILGFHQKEILPRCPFNHFTNACMWKAGILDLSIQANGNTVDDKVFKSTR